jgi:hypothetical protein
MKIQNSLAFCAILLIAVFSCKKEQVLTGESVLLKLGIKYNNFYTYKHILNDVPTGKQGLVMFMNDSILVDKPGQDGYAGKYIISNLSNESCFIESLHYNGSDSAIATFLMNAKGALIRSKDTTRLVYFKDGDRTKSYQFLIY